MLLHPLVENAVKYGMKTSEMPLKVLINAKVVNDQLYLEIRNSGRWINTFDRDFEEHAGTNTGLENVRKRLANSYQTNQKMEIIKNTDEVIIKIQLKRQLEDEHEKEA